MLLTVFNFSLNAEDDFNSYAKINVMLHDQLEMNELAKLGISLENISGKYDSGYELIINFHELKLIENVGFSFDVLIPDMREYHKNRQLPSEAEMEESFNRLQRDNIESYALGGMGGFHSRDEHISICNYLATTYPDIVSPLIQIGQSHEGVNIYAQRISDNPTVQESDEGNVYFDGLIHAREPMAGEVLLYYLYWLVENYGTDPEATYLIDNRQIYLVTVVNPDGYIYNQVSDPNGGGMWRKNRRNNGGSYGVDLNRNYGYQWGYDNTGSSGIVSSDTYRGPSAFSEPETQAVRDFILQVQPSIGFNCHTYTGVFINPYGYSGLPTSYEYYSEFAGDFAHNLNYPYGTSAEMIGYPSNGTARDWMHHDAQMFAWVPEIGETGFWPGQSEIIPLNSQFLPVLKYVTWVSGNYADYQKYEIMEGQAIPGDTLSLVLDVKNKGLSLDAVNVNINVTSLNGLATAINNTAIIDTIHSWEIKDNGSNPIQFLVSPSTTIMDELEFQVEIIQNNIVTSTENITIFVGEQNTIFFDDATAGKINWTTSGTGQQWDTTFVSYYSKWHSFGDSHFGSYSNNTNTYITLTNSLDLSGSENPRVEFAARWALEADFDYTRFEISSNGGSSWTVLAGDYTTTVSGQPGYNNIREGWITESIDISSYASSQVKFRFHLVSDGGLNTDGFYFDDFRIVDYQTPIINTIEDNDVIVRKFEVSENYPNPFNPETKIFYNLPKKASVNIYVVNILGEKITSLVSAYQDAGKQEISWNGTNANKENVVSGLYFIYFDVQADDNHYKSVKKCILLR
jgi:carboxypeptidase T